MVYQHKLEFLVVIKCQVSLFSLFQVKWQTPAATTTIRNSVLQVEHIERHMERSRVNVLETKIGRKTSPRLDSSLLKKERNGFPHENTKRSNQNTV